MKTMFGAALVAALAAVSLFIAFAIPGWQTTAMKEDGFTALETLYTLGIWIGCLALGFTIMLCVAIALANAASAAAEPEEITDEQE